MFKRLWCGKVQYRLPNTNTNPATEPLIYSLTCCNTFYGNGGTKLAWVARQFLIWLKIQSMKWNPYMALLGWPRTRDSDTYSKTKLLVKKREVKVTIKWLLIIFCNPHRPVSYSTNIREASSCSRRKRKQKPTVRHCTERVMWNRVL